MQNGMMKWLSKLLRFKDNQKGNNIIMKLVSSERIKNYIQTQINPYGRPFKGTAYEFGIKLLDYLNNKDADYDVEKVIEELSKKQNNKGFGGTLQEMFYDLGLEDAIEIVQSNGCVKTTLKKDNNGWIPCNERLPEEEKDYLCCYEYTEIGGTHEGENFKDYGVFYHDGYKWIKYWETINKKNIQVVAWQPLPEPYEEETEDE